jgi:tyrosine-protein phosphatase SIW14
MRVGKLVAASLAVATAAAVAGTPFLYRSWQSVRYRNLRVVEPGRLYRSGQMTPVGFAAVFREYGVRTVVSFRDTRDDGREPEDAAERAVCAEYGVRFESFPKADWSPGPDGVVSGDRNVSRWLTLLRDPATEYPVLMHCFAGIHRTGAYCAAYRLECGWGYADVVAEMEAAGTRRTTFADNLRAYLKGYKPGRMTGVVPGEPSPSGDGVPGRPSVP